jgi:3-methyladenine DNA glycosylase AlkD
VSVGSVEEVLQKLKAVAKPDRLDGMARYGMVVDRRLGVSVPDLRKIAKAVGKNHHLALELWRTGIPEARIVAQ